jgi:hypothetical protein
VESWTVLAKVKQCYCYTPAMACDMAGSTHGRFAAMRILRKENVSWSRSDVLAEASGSRSVLAESRSWLKYHQGESPLNRSTQPDHGSRRGRVFLRLSLCAACRTAWETITVLCRYFDGSVNYFPFPFNYMVISSANAPNPLLRSPFNLARLLRQCARHQKIAHLLTLPRSLVS